MRKNNPFSISNEPQFNPLRNEAADSPSGLTQPVGAPCDLEAAAHQSVWDEPSLATRFAGAPPKDALMYANWLAWRAAHWPMALSWFVTIVAGVFSTPFAFIVYWLLFANLGLMGAAIDGIVAPIFVELAKIALPFWIIEQRPFVFKRGAQILICGIMAGLIFGLVSGVATLFSLQDHSSAIQILAASGHTGIHLICSAISSIGLYRIWLGPMQEHRPPRASDGIRFICGAVAVHLVFSITFAVAIWLAKVPQAA
ncbi:MAG TPA: hypothetical protein PKD64_07340 [Pirellulaceae bacterium]|nr:hypothetical protein [Pirellulaceae bacterium]HMO91999.1 hypothetical protein [Pirellulaceae bacterium]HMP68798.1 hypothetical protein [Pirellulaceae bacterium]